MSNLGEGRQCWKLYKIQPLTSLYSCILREMNMYIQEINANTALCTECHGSTWKGKARPAGRQEGQASVLALAPNRPVFQKISADLIFT